VNTLNEKRIEVAHFLTTNPKRKLGRAGVVGAKETGRVGTTAADIGGLDPDVAQEITLSAQRNHNLVTTGEGPNIIETLGLECEVRMSLIILMEK